MTPFLIDFRGYLVIQGYQNVILTTNGPQKVKNALFGKNRKTPKSMKINALRFLTTFEKSETPKNQKTQKTRFSRFCKKVGHFVPFFAGGPKMDPLFDHFWGHFLTPFWPKTPWNRPCLDPWPLPKWTPFLIIFGPPFWPLKWSILGVPQKHENTEFHGFWPFLTTFWSNYGPLFWPPF